jgi:SAM-dependent methyltransferase
LGVAQRICQEEGITNIHFINSDIFSSGLKSKQFDLVFSRCTFQYLPGEGGKEALRNMKNLVRPDGYVAVADVDGVCLYRFPFDAVREGALDLLLSRLAPMGFDAFVGRKLYGMFLEAGFRDVCVNLLPYYLIAGRADPITVRVWEMKVQIINKYLVQIFESHERAKELTDRFMDDFQREDVLLYNFIFIVQGKA